MTKSFQSLWNLLQLSSALLATLASSAVQADNARPSLRPQIESRYFFPLQPELLEKGTPQYYARFFSKQEEPTQTSEFKSILEIDFPDYFQNRGRDTYGVMLGRVSFLVDQPVSFYSKSRLLDVTRMNRLMPEFPSRRDPKSSDVFLSDGTPNCKFRIEVFTRDEILALGARRPELRYAEKIHPELGVPDVVSLQHNYDFERVMGFKTSRGAITLTAHYSQGARKTLISTFSLGYLENTPPAIWGGAQLVIDASRDATLILIERLRKE